MKCWAFGSYLIQKLKKLKINELRKSAFLLIGATPLSISASYINNEIRNTGGLIRVQTAKYDHDAPTSVY